MSPYVNTHITEIIRVGDIANMLFLSNAAISNAFRAVYGCSIKDYIMRSKLEIASQLLREGEYEIADIAERLSFCDPQHFSKMFKRRYKISPAKYRNEFLTEIIKS